MTISILKYTPFSNGIKIADNISPRLSEAIQTSSAVKKLGKFYNTTVYPTICYTPDNIASNSYGLRFSSVKPKNIFVKLYNFLTNRKYKGIFFALNSKNEDEIIEALGSLSKNSLIKSLKVKK